MPLFVCSRCNGIDNTALGGNYWGRLAARPPVEEVLCTECHTGLWHGKFIKRIFDPDQEDEESILHMLRYGHIPTSFRANLRVIDIARRNSRKS